MSSQSIIKRITGMLVGITLALFLTGTTSALASDKSATAQLASPQSITVGISMFSPPRPAEVSQAAWWGTTTWYSRSDVHNYADWYGAINIAKKACDLAPGWARPTCKNTVGRYTGWITGTWQDAKAHGQCLSMSMTWTGQVTGIRAYDCNWG